MKRSRKHPQWQKASLVDEKPQIEPSPSAIPASILVPNAGLNPPSAKITTDYGCSKSSQFTHRSPAVQTPRLPNRVQQLETSSGSVYIARPDTRAARLAIDRAFLCAQCSAPLTQKHTLLRHIRTTHASVSGARCPHCGKTFALAAYLNNHIRRLHSAENASALRPLKFPCKYCPASFKSLYGQQYHHTKAHVGRPSNASLAGMSACICALCLMVYENRSQLYIHLHKLCPVSVRRYKCQQCASAFKTPTGLKYHLLSHSSSAVARQHPCPKCNAAFKSAVAVRSHQVVHLNEKPFACKECPATFSNMQYLVGHQERRHSLNAALKRFKCPHCSTLLRSSDSLRVHVAAVHLDSKRFICAICATSLKYRESMKEHLALHYRDGPENPRLSVKKQRRQLSIDEKRKRRVVYTMRWAAKKRLQGDFKAFACIQCGKTFKRREQLKEHTLVHRDERPFLCDQCPASFKSSGALKRHTLLHAAEGASFQCEYCPSSYTERSQVKRHQSAHFANLEFVCSSCSASYKRLRSLTKHERIHESDSYANNESREKWAAVHKQKCRDCGLSFANSKTLAAHSLKKHFVGPTVIKCARCGCAVKFKGELSRHIFMQHTRLEQEIQW